MANARFTRDEVILALDTLYYSGDEKLTASSETIRELCKYLQRLPIHPMEQRGADFRNETGVSRQLYLFQISCRTGRKDSNVGEIFFSVAHEFENDLDRLHSIASAIRRNLDSGNLSYCTAADSGNFPEGKLLEQLHLLIEKRDAKNVTLARRCCVCQLEPELLYQPCGSLLEHHLVADPVSLDGSKRYKSNMFITVCPNCHAALHRYRPWLDDKSCEKMLR